jgi:hypothetical protein
LVEINDKYEALKSFVEFIKEKYSELDHEELVNEFDEDSLDIQLSFNKGDIGT